ncbi:MAG: CapA family protein [Acidimicrobiia bacterium]
MTGETLRLALAGDTMLGRMVGKVLAEEPHRALFSDEVVAAVREADLFVLNLECCISERGERWADPSKPFFFRAPPRAVEVLKQLGVDCVTLANNHALDYGPVALEDTLDLLAGADIEVVGAGRNLAEARRSALLSHHGFRLRVVGFTDHPAEFGAGEETPGVAYTDLGGGVPGWVLDTLSVEGDSAVLVTPHWGPNMTASPVRRVREAATSLVEVGATLVAGHSAHVFHGVAGRVLYDLGDFVDDYAVDHHLRNDLGLLFLVDLGPYGPRRLEAVPLALEFCHTRLARADEAARIAHRFQVACAEFGTDVDVSGDRLVVEWPRGVRGMNL